MLISFRFHTDRNGWRSLISYGSFYATTVQKDGFFLCCIYASKSWRERLLTGLANDFKFVCRELTPEMSLD